VEKQMDEADTSIEAYDKLYKSVPTIGFLNRKKRVRAYIKVTNIAQQLIDEKEISEDQALYLLSILVRKYSSFQKASMMTALNLSDIDQKLISTVGFKYANDFRCSLNMLPVDYDNPIQP
jgi:lipopolysaccharide biosynthesis regulator YciM